MGQWNWAIGVNTSKPRQQSQDSRARAVEWQKQCRNGNAALADLHSRRGRDNADGDDKGKNEKGKLLEAACWR